MKRRIIMIFFIAASLVSCATTTNYPITLSYKPLKPQYEKTGEAAITVANLSDKRPVADKRIIGTKDNSAEFVALADDPATALSKGFAVYLVNRGYTVNRTDEPWDGEIQSIKPGQGNFLIGGTLDNLTLNVKEQILKTEYDCEVKFTLAIADAGTKQLLHKEKFDVTTSYVTLPFNTDEAETSINQAISEAVEKGLADVNKYVSPTTMNK